jgi:hypothetical protein
MNDESGIPFSNLWKIAGRPLIFFEKNAKDGMDTGSRLVERILPILPVRPFSAGDPGAGHPLAQAAFLDKVLFKPEQLLIHQIVGLVDPADRDIGNRSGRTSLYEFTVQFIGLRLLPPELANKQRLL